MENWSEKQIGFNSSRFLSKLAKFLKDYILKDPFHVSNPNPLIIQRSLFFLNICLADAPYFENRVLTSAFAVVVVLWLLLLLLL